MKPRVARLGEAEDESRGLFGEETLTWRLNREQFVLLAGPAAAVLQVAHPVVARGVAAHSNFRTDAAGRLTRTLDAVYAVAFGSTAQVDAVRQRVGRMHRAVQGEGYSAFDPAAQLWVLATLIYGSVTMFERFVGGLTNDEKAEFLQENRRFAQVFGLHPNLVWSSWEEFARYWQEMVEGDLLGSEPLCADVAQGVLSPKRPRSFRALSPLIHALAMELIPERIAERLALRKAPLRGTVWGVLDFILPRVLHMLPERMRFCSWYLQARKRIANTNGEP